MAACLNSPVHMESGYDWKRYCVNRPYELDPEVLDIDYSGLFPLDSRAMDVPSIDFSVRLVYRINHPEVLQRMVDLFFGN